MYERSAIVLERYLQITLGYRKRSNLKINYKNYCKLIENVEKYQAACVKEKAAVKEFNEISEEISDIQSRQNKLYKKGGKLEYNRNIIFDNIEADPDETEKCVEKIEISLEKNSTELVELRKSFIEKIRKYAVVKLYMQECRESKKEAEIEYKEALIQTMENMQKIDAENVEFVNKFITSDNEDIKAELARVMTENGEGEKNPFDTDVILSAVNLGIDIAKKEAECYIFIHEKTEKLLADIEKRLIEINRYKRWARDITVKLNFLNAEKEYLVQFLDYERITVIHPKKVHKKLMQEACANLETDVVQINNLFELILREIAGKSTKKGYKQLYNKSYLAEMEKTEVDFEKEKDKININAATLINSNYWRIEGIKNIYTVFYKDVSEVYGKDLVEFDLPKEDRETEKQEVLETPKKEIKVEKETEEVAVNEESEEKDSIDAIFEKKEDSEIVEQEEEEDELIFIDSDEDEFNSNFLDEDEEQEEESDNSSSDDDINNDDDLDSGNSSEDEKSLFENDEEDDYDVDFEDEDSNEDEALEEELEKSNSAAFEENNKKYESFDSMEYLGLEVDDVKEMLSKEVDFDELRKIKKQKFFEKLSKINKRERREAN